MMPECLSSTCRRRVADMSPTSPNVAKSWPTLRVVATQKRPRTTQFISITTDKYKSAQTYGYLSHRVFVFELKQQSQNYRHVRNPPTCRQMSCRFGHPADTTLSCVCDMTSDVSRHVANMTQNVAVWATKSTRRHPTCGAKRNAHVGEPSRTCHGIDLHILKTDGLLERLCIVLDNNVGCSSAAIHRQRQQQSER